MELKYPGRAGSVIQEYESADFDPIEIIADWYTGLNGIKNSVVSQNVTGHKSDTESMLARPLHR
jgi:hypothetical protein